MMDTTMMHQRGRGQFTMRASGVLTLLASSVCVMGGCSTANQPVPAGFSIRQSPEMTRDVALLRAEEALLSLGYHLEERQPVAGVLRTDPLMIPAGETTTTTRPGGRRPTWVIVEVRVRNAVAAVELACRAELHEESTAAHLLYLRDQGRSDVPSETPIERDAATSERQNRAWRAIGRDRAREQAILAAILGAADDGTPAPPAASQP
jgi:hypothetical protein